MKSIGVIFIGCLLFILFLRSILVFSWTQNVWPQEIDERLVQAIIQVESGGNPSAYNDKSGAIGLMQITPIVIKEFNEQHKSNIQIDSAAWICPPVTKEILYFAECNKYIGTWYLNTRIPQMLKYYNIPDTIYNRLISYNAGIEICKNYHRGKIKRLPRETRNYIERVEKVLKKEDLI